MVNLNMNINIGVKYNNFLYFLLRSARNTNSILESINRNDIDISVFQVSRFFFAI